MSILCFEPFHEWLLAVHSRSVMFYPRRSMCVLNWATRAEKPKGYVSSKSMMEPSDYYERTCFGMALVEDKLLQPF